MNNKVATIVEGLIIAVIGVLISIFGPTQVIDTTFAIIAIAFGAVLLVFSVLAIVQKRDINASLTILGSVLLFVGIFLLTSWLSFGVLVNFVVIVLMGLGVGLIILGLLSVSKKNLPLGVSQLVIGALLTLFTSLYLGVEGFRSAFWIIIGIVIAIYGVLMTVSALLVKGKKR